MGSVAGHLSILCVYAMGRAMRATLTLTVESDSELAFIGTGGILL